MKKNLLFLFAFVTLTFTTAAWGQSGTIQLNGTFKLDCSKNPCNKAPVPSATKPRTQSSTQIPQEPKLTVEQFLLIQKSVRDSQPILVQQQPAAASETDKALAILLAQRNQTQPPAQPTQVVTQVDMSQTNKLIEKNNSIAEQQLEQSKRMAGSMHTANILLGVGDAISAANLVMQIHMSGQLDGINKKLNGIQGQLTTATSQLSNPSITLVNSIGSVASTSVASGGTTISSATGGNVQGSGNSQSSAGASSSSSSKSTNTTNANQNTGSGGQNQGGQQNNQPPPCNCGGPGN